MYKSFKGIAMVAGLQAMVKRDSQSNPSSAAKTGKSKNSREASNGQLTDTCTQDPAPEDLNLAKALDDATDESGSSDEEESENSESSTSSDEEQDEDEEESSDSDSDREKPPPRKNKQGIDHETWAKKVKDFAEIEDFLRGASSSLSIVFFGPDNVLDSFQRLFFLYKYQSSYRSKMGDVLASQEYAGEILNILRIALNMDGTSDVMSVIGLGMLILMNFSDASDKFATELAEAGAIEFLSKILAPEQFKDSITTELKQMLEQNSLGILHNMAKVGGMKSRFNKARTVKVVQPYVKSKDEETSAIALLILAYVVEEEDKTTLIDDMNVIGNCIDWLNQALQDERRRHRGFSAWELAQGLAKLAANDSNKTKITEKGALKPLLKLLQLNDPKEQSASAKCLLNLTFDKDAVEKIREYPGLLPALEKLRNNNHKRVKKYVQRALLMIKGNDSAGAIRPVTPRDQYDVFISYSWSDKEVARRIHKELETVGYKVWIDTERMEGSTLQAMAEAVEKSAIILICVSEHYKQSLNCRTEAEYTFSKGKEYVPLMMQPKYKPDGWLGAMHGVKLFFDFTGKYPFEESFQKLLKELQSKLILVSDHVPDKPELATIPVPKTPKEICSAMSRRDVRNLLKTKGLKELPPELSKMDGEFLWQLKELRGNDRQNFYKIMSNEYDMSLTDVTKLNAAMDTFET